MYIMIQFSNNCFHITFKKLCSVKVKETRSMDYIDVIIDAITYCLIIANSLLNEDTPLVY